MCQANCLGKAGEGDAFPHWQSQGGRKDEAERLPLSLAEAAIGSGSHGSSHWSVTEQVKPGFVAGPLYKPWARVQISKADLKVPLSDRGHRAL